MQLLDGLLSKEMTFREVEKSLEIKSMHLAKDVLLQKVECETWEEAAEALPQYCNEQAMSQFKVVKGKALPDDFRVSVTFTLTYALILTHCSFPCIYL